METGTLKELNVKPGDVVEFCENGPWYPRYVGRHFDVIDNLCAVSKENGDSFASECAHTFRIVSRASDTPKTWGEMTDAEKGALLLASHEGKVIEVFCWDHDWSGWNVKPSPVWNDDRAYRIKPAPKRETVTLSACRSDWSGKWNAMQGSASMYTHNITFTTLDGQPITGTYRDDEGNEVRIERIGQ